MIHISPSVLAADFSDLKSEISNVENAVDWLHLDVMDGVFVPNISIGPAVVSCIRKRTSLFFDVHLMIVHPEKYADAFIDAGADLIDFHVEASDDPRGLLAHIRERGRKCALAVSPDTPVECVFPYLDVLDMVLVMTVYPGFGGQKFMPRMLPKIACLRREIVRRGLSVDIEVDGGISKSNASDVAQYGANVLVAGSSVFRAASPALSAGEIRILAESSYTNAEGIQPS